MRLFLVVIALWAAVSATAMASPLDGRWKVDFLCTAGKSVCQGRSDSFNLDIWSSGDRLCGTHLATAHLGNRVDENDTTAPSIGGLIVGNTATVTFESGWGGSGKALLKLNRSKLNWHIIDDNGKVYWLPKSAILLKQGGARSIAQAKDEEDHCP